MARLSFLLSLISLSFITTALPLDTRAAISSSSLVGFPQTVPSGATGALYLKYKPYLNVVNGCVPFPAVDANGNTNAGLNPTGATNGGCSSSTGQVYTRSATYNNQFAIMYAWYWPKDEPIDGAGHRHDWESIVVWLDSTKTKLLGVAASAHGDFSTNTNPSLSGSGPLIEYISYFPLDHQLDFTSTKGGQQPLVAWESLPAVAQQALTNTDFGDANVPFKDANFMNNLAEAAL